MVRLAGRWLVPAWQLSRPYRIEGHQVDDGRIRNLRAPQ